MKKLLFLNLILISSSMLAQKQSTFIYELTLFDQYKHRAMWTDRERDIQQQHVSYLNSLEASGELLIAGIMDQNLEEHTGFVMLTIESHEKAFEIVQNDPSVKEGMMSARLRPVNIYFLKD